MKTINLTLLFCLFNISLYANESVFDSVESSSEEDALAENYIHQGKADAQTLESCAEGVNGYKDICTNDSGAFKGGGMQTLENMLPALTAAYSMFNSAVSAQGGGLTKTYYKETDGVSEIDTSKGTDGKESSPDYCAYIGMAGEAASTAYTTIQNNKTQETYISETAQASQAATFYALADSHKTLKKASTVQAGIWGATAACYVAYATQASYTGDWKVWAKMAAATFIGLYYKKKADAHDERYDLLMKMAKDLPQAGECNPYNQKSCFCAEETSILSDPVNYNKYCEPNELAKDSKSEESYAYVCTDSKGKTDEDCSCATTGTCISKKVITAGANLGLDPTALKSALSAIKPINNGLADASLAKANANNSALAKKAMNQFKPTTAPNLTSDQKKIAATLSRNGIPKAAAAYLAKGGGGSTSSLPANALGGVSKSSLDLKKKNSALGKKPTLANANFQNGGNVPGKKSSSSSSSLLNRFKNKNNKMVAVEIEGYAQEAEEEAAINQDSSRFIFDIISYRYKSSELYRNNILKGIKSNKNK